MLRRTWLRWLTMSSVLNAVKPSVARAPSSVDASPYPPVERGAVLTFPRDHGAHPPYRIEWWYATGWLEGADGPLGMQITFFRSRLAHADDSPSRFAPRQIVFAHAALADPSEGRLRHAQEAQRTGFGDAAFSEDTTDVRLHRWSLARQASNGHYRAVVATREFDFDLELAPTQPLLLQGDAGWSRKGPRPEQASYYYSQPHLAVQGRVLRRGRPTNVTGRAWLDHEWSSTLLDPRAAGWDWIGINLDDGGALMAFRIRPKDGHDAALWAGGTHRDASGRVRTFAPEAISFRPTRWWTSPRTQTRYPVEFEVRAGDLTATLSPLLDDQELDSRESTGAVYWEGAVELRQAGRRIGRGYLELTGYAGALRL
ncbi:MAG TPA: lipocalin-like domain-containing protein [Burkholderiaceae bacterium]|nr:lipocalin-like domain-containing protein [Burkholderiaceae bacterium]